VEGPFVFCEDQSAYQSSQILLVMDKQASPQMLPRLLQVQLTGSQVGSAGFGDQILVSGTLNIWVSTHREYGKQKTFTPCLEAHTLKISPPAQGKETP
jgi:DNA replicative helicase MCM subunit Mcm2 (Cdc46/Mcm family)